jgi:hypothetical protein
VSASANAAVRLRHENLDPTIAGTAFNYQAVADTTLAQIASELASLIDAHASYAAAASGSGITVSDGAGTAVISVTLESGIAISPTVNAADIADPAYDRTIDLTGTSVVVGGDYTVTIAGSAFTYRAVTGDTLSQIASGLAGQIDAHGSYAASPSGNLITVSDGAGISAIALSSVGPVNGIEGVSIGATTTGSLRTIDLSSLDAVNGATYTVRIAGTAYSYTADGSATRQEIANGLVAAISSAHSPVARVVTVAQTWDAVLAELDTRIEAGEPVTVAADATNRKLTLGSGRATRARCVSRRLCSPTSSQTMPTGH